MNGLSSKRYSVFCGEIQSPTLNLQMTSIFHSTLSNQCFASLCHTVAAAAVWLPEPSNRMPCSVGRMPADYKGKDNAEEISCCSKDSQSFDRQDAINANMVANNLYH